MKPFDPEELVAMMDQIVQRREFIMEDDESVTVEELRRDLNEVKNLLLANRGGDLKGRLLGGGASDNGDNDVLPPKDSIASGTDASSQSTAFDDENDYASYSSDQSSIVITSDEMDVLELLCQGYMNKEIAAELQYSTRWVEGHLTSMFRKTNCSNRTELVRWAVANEYVDI